MAKADAQKQVAVDEQKKSLIARVAPIVIVTILAGGGGFLQGAMFRNSSPKSEGVVSPEVASANEGETDSTTKREELPPSESVVVRSLAPIISNLGTPTDTWMRLELSLLMDQTAAADQDVIVVKAADAIVKYLRTVDLKTIEGPSGYLHFREDLSDMLIAEFENKITGVLIGSMVVE